MTPMAMTFTLSARSSDDGVVTVRTQLSAVVVEGVDVGSGIIMVTATDPDGKTGELSFTVDVPNREPVGSTIPPVSLTTDALSADVTLTEHFTDSDGHALTFTAQSSDPAIVSATVTESILTLQSEGNGSARVRVVATDPHGFSATEDIEVSVSIHMILVRDDFDDSRLAVAWTVWPETVATLRNGRLALSTTSEITPGTITQETQRAENWMVSANVERTTDDLFPTLTIFTGDVEWELYMIMIGADVRRFTDDPVDSTNLAVVAAHPTGLFSVPGMHGLYDEIKGPGQAMDVAVSIDSSWLDVVVDGTRLIRIDLEEGTLPDLPASVEGIGLMGFQSPDVAPVDPDRDIAYFDWLQLDGLPTTDSSAQLMTARSAALFRQILLREVKVRK